VPNEPDDVAVIPRVLGVNIGISFFEESTDPVIVINAVLSGDMLEKQLAHFGGVEGTCVVPLAFDPTALQGVIPEIIESVIRAKTVTEMFTIWPEQKDEIVKNLVFRWTGQVTGDETDGDGAADS